MSTPPEQPGTANPFGAAFDAISHAVATGRNALATNGNPGSFRIDPDTAARVISDLREASQELSSIRDEARLLGRVDPGSRDSVSIDFATALSRTADGGRGSLVWALGGAIDLIERLIGDMENDVAAYRHADDTTRAGFDRRA